MNTPFHKTDRTPEQVWKDYVVAVAKLDQQRAVNKNLRVYRAKSQQREVIVSVIKGAK